MKLARAAATLWLCALGGCTPKSPPEEELPAPHVSVAVVTPRDVVETLTVSGVLTAPPGKDVKLGALAAGRVAEVNVSEGDPVQKGQLLAKLDPGPLQDSVQQAEAALAEAEAVARNDAVKLERAKKLFALGVSARQEVDDAQASADSSAARVATAKAALSTARTQLSRSELFAPFDGVVVRVFASRGEPVDANKEIVEVADLRVLELRAGVAAKDVGRVRAGMKAEVEVEGVPSPVTAEVLTVAPGVDPSTGTVALRLRMVNPGTLRLGQLARAKLELARHLGVPAVPTSALVPIQDSGERRLGVVTVGAERKVRRVPVEVGASDGTWTEVRSGVGPGELIVSSGGYALPDGTVVSYDAPAPPASSVPDGGSSEQP